MRKKMLSIFAVVGIAFLLAGCDDPNESGVPDGIDFKSSTVTHDRVNVTTEVIFYSNYASMEFFYYFDHDNNGDAEFLVRCGASSFTVAKESNPNSGLYDVLTHSGTAIVSGNTYHIEFPLSALDIDGAEEFSTHYWFFESSKGDRMPNSGSKSLANIL
ncbi:hypothetical protein JXJ21_19350 [candidate division KSB1 bacterium]|nr:hypothetical protein [candidate division KSB1 bacterium]